MACAVAKLRKAQTEKCKICNLSTLEVLSLKAGLRERFSAFYLRIVPEKEDSPFLRLFDAGLFHFETF